ncbi:MULTISPECIES: hypothetical protein [unclassified Pseudomonas]|uniref:hypothetical protein n=1 Tax=unclassified Pseudomonas TaxID=196821 RepID=UPI002B223796|nr:MULTISPECIES: hypothetical protein [unclassified Pseudomonas]MEB0218065.1 hypothetical protein [Pseudomonas sp. AB12(2023)]
MPESEADADADAAQFGIDHKTTREGSKTALLFNQKLRQSRLTIFELNQPKPGMALLKAKIFRCVSGHWSTVT